MSTRLIRPELLYAVPVLLLGVSLYMQLGAMLNHDVAWYLVAAERLLDGGGYETNFFEVNMPQVIVMHIPPLVLSEAAGMSLPDAARLWVVLLALQSIGLTVVVQRAARQPLIQGEQWPMWLSWLVIGYLMLPGYDFGQREHLIIILSVPFLFMLASGRRSQTPALRIYVTALAAVGFYLKPHFAMLPFLLLAVDAYRLRSWWALLTLEAAVLAGVGVGLALWIVAYYPDWVAVAKWALDLYGAYGDMSWESLVRAGAPIVLAALVGMIALLADRRFRHHAWPLITVAVYACVVFLLQWKGWKYQFLPVVLVTFLATGLAVARCMQSMQEKEAYSAVRLGVAAVLALLLAREAVVDARSMRRSWTMQLDPVAGALRATGNGENVFVFSVEMHPAFPAVVHFDLGWGSRYSTLWPLVKLLRARHRPDVESNSHLLDKYWGRFVDTIVYDFERYRPSRVLIDMNKFSSALPPGKEVVWLFRGHQRFEQIWQRYQRVGEVNGYRVYQRVEKSN